MTARIAEVSRKTAETQITVKVNLDGTGVSKLSTGIGFFDHMLDQIARHGLIDLEIHATGDLHIDGHHTVEDVGITLGQAVAKAIGDKKGITRYGHAYVPLDEALSRVVVDFSGRPGLVMHVPFKAGMIGEFDSHRHARVGDGKRFQLCHAQLGPAAIVGSRIVSRIAVIGELHEIEWEVALVPGLAPTADEGALLR